MSAGYLDIFIAPIVKEKLKQWEAVCKASATVLKDNGAIAVYDGLADDVPYGVLTSIPRGIQLKEDEVTWVTIVLHESRSSRDAINEKYLLDPRLAEFTDAPYDGKRAVLGGFELKDLGVF